MANKVGRPFDGEKHIGLKVNRWVIDGVERDDGVSYAHATCSCGTKKKVKLHSVVAGKIKSCGCWRRENSHLVNVRHGLTRTKTHRAWSSMKTRCYDKNSPVYQRYGARGITVCDRWYHSFDNFLSDMGICPEGLSLDRIDNSGNYEPGNCRWATWSQQNKNRRKFKRRSKAQIIADKASEDERRAAVTNQLQP